MKVTVTILIEDDDPIGSESHGHLVQDSVLERAFSRALARAALSAGFDVESLRDAAKLMK